MNTRSFCIVAIAIIAINLIGSSKALNKTFGCRIPGDFLLYRENVWNAPQFLKVASGRVEYPPKNLNVTQYPISAIYAIDHQVNNGGDISLSFGNGGDVFLFGGGPKERYATVRMESALSGGLNYTIEFYGR